MTSSTPSTALLAYHGQQKQLAAQRKEHNMREAIQLLEHARKAHQQILLKKQEVERLKGQISELSETVERLENTLRERTELLEKARKVLQDLRERQSTNEQAQARLEQQISELQEKQSQLNKEIVALHTLQAQDLENMEVLRDQIADAQEKIDEAKQRIAELASESKALAQEIRAAQQAGRQASRSLQLLQQKQSRLQEKEKALSAKEKGVKSLIAQLQSNIESLQEQIEQLKIERSKAQDFTTGWWIFKKTHSLAHKREELTIRIERLEAQLARQERQLSDNENRLNSLDTEAEQTRSARHQVQDDIIYQTGIVRDTQDDIAERSIAIGKLNDEIAAEKNRLDEDRHNIQALKVRYRVSQLTEAQQERARIEATGKMEAVTQAIGAKQEELATHKANFPNLTDQIRTAEHDADQLEQSERQVREELGATASQLANVKSEHENLHELLKVLSNRSNTDRMASAGFQTAAQSEATKERSYHRVINLWEKICTTPAAAREAQAEAYHQQVEVEDSFDWNRLLNAQSEATAASSTVERNLDPDD